MSQLGDLLRESAVGTTGSERTMMLSVLEEDDQIDGGDQAVSKWTTLKHRLRFDWVGCCSDGPNLRLRQSSEIPIAEEDDNEEEEDESSGQNRVVELSVTSLGTGLDCLTRGTRNLVETLAEERLARGEHVTETPVARVPLMRLLAETDGCDSTTTWMSSDHVCCVDMGREKGAAFFIPCGHTYCRVCSREIWMNRGKCPLCNRSINDVLDLY